jgi:DNA modification methylase
MSDLRHADCFAETRTLADESIDLVLTSPPYADLKTYGEFKGIPADEYVEWFMPLVKELYRVLKPTGSFILNINDKVEGGFRNPYVFDLVSRICRETGFKLYERLFWNKMKGLPNPHRFGDRVEFVFWFVKARGFTMHLDEMRVPYKEGAKLRMRRPIKDRFARTENNLDVPLKEWKPNEKGGLPTTLVELCSETKHIAKTHVAVFPERFVDYFVRGSTNPGDLVLDPFLGTGTTAVVCAKLGRKFLGYDINEEYVRVAQERLSNL